jgi:hypothetical protein
MKTDKKLGFTEIVEASDNLINARKTKDTDAIWS